MGYGDEYEERRLGCFRITLLIVFTIFQLAAIALGIAAIAVPDWMSPGDVPVLYDEQVKVIGNVGLYQICEADGEYIGGDTDDNSTRWEITKDKIRQVTSRQTFAQIASDSCSSGGIVEDFYKNELVFQESMYVEFNATRGLTIIFVIFAFVKMINLLASKCRDRWCSYAIGWVAAIIEAGSAIGALITYGLILQDAAEKAGKDGIDEYWGIAYQMFLAAAAIAVVADIGFFF